MSKNGEWITKDVLAVEGIAWALTAVLFIATVVAIQGMPETVPTHFGFDGTPDAWGSPMSHLALPACVVFCNALMSLVLHLVDARYWNRPGTLEEGEETAWYRASARAIAWSMLEFVLFCAVASFLIVTDAAAGILPLSAALVVVVAATSIKLCGRFYLGRSKKG